MAASKESRRNNPKFVAAQDRYKAKVSSRQREIGKLPPVVSAERKASCERDFRKFCETYYPHLFGLPWSADHLKVIAKIEKAVLDGGLFAMAMPRGSGKTTLCACAAVWAVLYGHHRFVALFAATAAAAKTLLASVRNDIESNDLLAEDFPEVCFPVRKLEGIAIRAHGQTYQGNRTHIIWKTEFLCLPTMPNSKASGGCFAVSGVTGSIRGMRFPTHDGEVIRPSFVLIDDPQTDRSAKKQTQSQSRINTVMGSILGLAGPGKRIAGIMPCTVIAPGDMADQMLNPEIYPEWCGERTKLVYEFPRNEELWKKYAEIRAESFRTGNGVKLANEFYVANRTAMDEGAVVAWPDRFRSDEISAIQHAMNLRYRDEVAFWAEYQNDPIIPGVSDESLTVTKVREKMVSLARGVIPLTHDCVTAMVDVQQNSLWWMVASWRLQDFDGHIVAYGVWPQQRTQYFQLTSLTTTLADLFPGASVEARIHQALAGEKGLLPQLLGSPWKREDGLLMPIDRLLCDANWAKSTRTIYSVFRDPKWSGIPIPSRGKSVTVDQKPMGEYRAAQGERIGEEWVMRPAKGMQSQREIAFDTNYWKSFVASRLLVKLGGSGGITLHDQHDSHALLSEHFTAEFAVKTAGKGRTVDVWREKPGRPDNHWWDGLVGCAVAASERGASLAAHARPAANKAKRISLSQLQKSRGIA